jgi:nitroimidazol reductase NimA-like FMN-containing flavoprotein (pyridoxamine 5'-phosphate oxidase superfamily)
MTDAAYPTTPRNRVRRYPDRARYDEAGVHAVLDAGLLAHVGYVIDGQPFVTPTAYWREGRRLYWHGSAASRMIRAQASGLPVCVTVSHLDGLIAARSAFVHSIQYRSVMAFGRARLVEGLEARRAALSAFLDRLYPGRTTEVRPPTDNELKQTSVIEMEIEEAVAKAKTGGVSRIEADEAWDAWSGVIPISTVVGERLADAVQSAGAPVSPSLGLYLEGARLDEVLAAAAASGRVEA